MASKDIKVKDIKTGESSIARGEIESISGDTVVVKYERSGNRRVCNTKNVEVSEGWDLR